MAADGHAEQPHTGFSPEWTQAIAEDARSRIYLVGQDQTRARAPGPTT